MRKPFDFQRCDIAPLFCRDNPQRLSSKMIGNNGSTNKLRHIDHAAGRIALNKTIWKQSGIATLSSYRVLCVQESALVFPRLLTNQTAETQFCRLFFVKTNSMQLVRRQLTNYYVYMIRISIYFLNGIQMFFCIFFLLREKKRLITWTFEWTNIFH